MQRGAWRRVAIVPLVITLAWAASSQLAVDADVTSSPVVAVAPGTTSAPASTTSSVAFVEPEVEAITSTTRATIAPATSLTTTSSTTTLPSSSAVAPSVIPDSVPLVTSTVPPASIGERALRRVRFDWRSAFPGWEIEFLGPRDGLRALTYPRERRVEVFVRDADTEATLHRVIAHELGHVLDVEYNSADDRDRWIAQRGIDSSVPWWPSASAPDFATGAGDFAEAFAVWETGITTRSSVGAQPSQADLDLLIELSRG